MNKNVDEKRDNYRSLYAIIGVLTITTRMTQIDENNIILKKKVIKNNHRPDMLHTNKHLTKFNLISISKLGNHK